MNATDRNIANIMRIANVLDDTIQTDEDAVLIIKYAARLAAKCDGPYKQLSKALLLQAYDEEFANLNFAKPQKPQATNATCGAAILRAIAEKYCQLSASKNVSYLAICLDLGTEMKAALDADTFPREIALVAREMVNHLQFEILAYSYTPPPQKER